MVNTSNVAVAYVQTPDGAVEYEGDARIDGVPGTAAPISLEFLDVAGSSCGALLPTGQVVDQVDNVEVTCIDNGMPVVILDALDFGLSGTEQPHELEANAGRRAASPKTADHSAGFANQSGIAAWVFGFQLEYCQRKSPRSVACIAARASAG
jgi:2-methylaconitate cis-trans-isomerase PrpF